ncbi:MAG: AtzE family amidohydrolase [Nibricoccus sp.]
MTFVPHTATALEISAAIRARKATARSVTEALLSRITDTHTRLNAFTAVTAERALNEASIVDEALANGVPPGPLTGVPYAVKNLFDLEGVVTTAGSKINRSYPPATSDATAVSRLKAAGAICLGALNMGEYAYDFVTENVHDGPCHNPHDLTRSAGGSSGGSGAAVAAGLVPISLGTDTNGSIRVPSSFCGLFGLKPTYGRLGRGGSFPFVHSIDHIGPFARSVADLAASYDAMQGFDPRDAACTTRAPEFVLPSLEKTPAGLRIATLGGYFEKNATPQALAAVATIAAALGATARTEIPEAALARAAGYTISACEGGQLHLERLRTRATDFDPNMRDRLLAGALTPAAWYTHAQRFRAWWREQVRTVFERVDILLAPATPVSATLLGQPTMKLDGVEMLVRPNLGIFTQPISFAGLPVVAVPIHKPGEMPIAVQIIGAPWTESMLLRIARQLEKSGVCTAPVAVL